VVKCNLTMCNLISGERFFHVVTNFCYRVSYQDMRRGCPLPAIINAKVHITYQRMFLSWFKRHFVNVGNMLMFPFKSQIFVIHESLLIQRDHSPVYTTKIADKNAANVETFKFLNIYFSLTMWGGKFHDC
jgi:hypothetical protein